MNDFISRQAAIDALNEQIEQCNKALGSFDISLKDEFAIKVEMASLEAYKEQLENLSPVQPEIIRCEDCKYFELDHFEKVDGFPIPIIVAHEICMKWGDGCKSSIDGWCFMAERRN